MTYLYVSICPSKLWKYYTDLIRGVYLFILTQSHYTVQLALNLLQRQAGLELVAIPLPQHPDNYDYRYVPSCPALSEYLIQTKFQETYKYDWEFKH